MYDRSQFLSPLLFHYGNAPTCSSTIAKMRLYKMGYELLLQISYPLDPASATVIYMVTSKNGCSKRVLHCIGYSNVNRVAIFNFWTNPIKKFESPLTRRIRVKTVYNKKFNFFLEFTDHAVISYIECVAH